jgi:hypothetical protein
MKMWQRVVDILSMKLVKNSTSVVADKTFLWRWRLVPLRLLVIGLGGLHTWAAATSHSMNADGISYLDIGDAYFRGEWQTAINSFWSPMYSWILGLVMRLLNPPMHWEFPVVHLVNFVVYLGAFVCFEFFWRQLMHYQQTQTVNTSGDNRVTLPEWAWLGLGYALFIWSSLHLIEIWAVTPDMLMAASVYLAAGLVLRIRLGADSWRTFGLLGGVLGLGYLTKAVMWPMAFVFLGVGLFSVGNMRRAVPRGVVALAVFLLLSTPFVAAISGAKGYLTYGGAGILTYVRHVNGVRYPHWQGEPPGNGVPEHPSRKILDVPPIYEFGTPIGGTYPISYDPSYWYEGVVVRLDLDNQIRSFLSSALFYFDLFFRQQGALLFGVFVLYLMSHLRSLPAKGFVQRWGLAILALAAFAMYGLVLVSGRYIGVFVVLFWSDLLANVRLPESQASRRLVSVLSVIMILSMLVNIVVFNLEGYRDLTGGENLDQPARPQAGPPSWPGEVAEALHKLGVDRGDKVGVIGYGFDSYWARLARVLIVAEMLGDDADDFWVGGPSIRDEVFQAFANTGSKAIVAENVPSYASLSNWHRVGNSNYYVFILAQ